MKSSHLVTGYKMTSDTGFAPNPFHDHLTLATCKPAIRRTRKKSEWIAGFVSRQLERKARDFGASVPYMGLVYLMEITEDPLPLAAYFEDPRFTQKKPIVNCKLQSMRCGDNIYSDDGKGGYKWWPNQHHDRGALKHDTSGLNALISVNFWYFGREARVPKENWTEFLGEPLSEGRTFFCLENFLERTLNYFNEEGFGPGCIGVPCMWKPDQASGERLRPTGVC